MAESDISHCEVITTVMNSLQTLDHKQQNANYEVFVES